MHPSFFPLRVVSALPAHLPLLAGVEQAAATVFPPGTIPDAIRSDAMPFEELEEGMRRNTLWVALSGDTPVGFALLRFAGGIALLAEMDVVPEHARRGLGRALVEKAAARARQEGYSGLYLTTFAAIPWNAPLYARLGFTLVKPAELPPFLVETLREERKRGLTDRVAMRLALAEAVLPPDSFL